MADRNRWHRLRGELRSSSITTSGRAARFRSRMSRQRPTAIAAGCRSPPRGASATTASRAP
uniref:Uncharacterized protein n=1 Tax=Arundo donax TaxID=35708 RepID=A0A0A8Z3G4_ARUDO